MSTTDRITEHQRIHVMGGRPATASTLSSDIETSATTIPDPGAQRLGRPRRRERCRGRVDVAMAVLAVAGGAQSWNMFQHTQNKSMPLTR